jgi:hypothetical protein
MRVYDYVNVSPYKNWIDPLPTFQEAAYPPFARGPRLTAAYRRLSPVSAAGATRHRGRAHVGGGFPPIPPPSSSSSSSSSRAPSSSRPSKKKWRVSSSRWWSWMQDGGRRLGESYALHLRQRRRVDIITVVRVIDRPVSWSWSF